MKDTTMEQIRTYTVADVLARLGDTNIQLVDIRDVRELADGTTIAEHFARRAGNDSLPVHQDQRVF